MHRLHTPWEHLSNKKKFTLFSLLLFVVILPVTYLLSANKVIWQPKAGGEGSDYTGITPTPDLSYSIEQLPVSSMVLSRDEVKDIAVDVKKDGNLITGSDEYIYEWTVENPTIVGIGLQRGCSEVDLYCSQHKRVIWGIAEGTTQVRVSVYKGEVGAIVASAVYQVTVTSTFVGPPTPTTNPTQHGLILEKYPPAHVKEIVFAEGKLDYQYLIYVILKNDGAVMVNQKDYAYSWSIDDASIAQIYPSTLCHFGIVPPCPPSTLKVKSIKPGTTTLHLQIKHTPSGQIKFDETWKIIVAGKVPIPTISINDKYSVVQLPSVAFAMPVSIAGQSGSITASLHRNGKVAGDLNNFLYTWTIADPTIAQIVPNTDKLKIVATKIGSSTIKVSVRQKSTNKEVVAATYFIRVFGVSPTSSTPLVATRQVLSPTVGLQVSHENGVVPTGQASKAVQSNGTSRPTTIAKHDWFANLFGWFFNLFK